MRNTSPLLVSNVVISFFIIDADMMYLLFSICVFDPIPPDMPRSSSHVMKNDMTRGLAADTKKKNEMELGESLARIHLHSDIII